MEDYDVAIIGAGPGGLSAGIYTARDRLKTLIIGKLLKSTATYASLLENYPGYKGTGLELLKKMRGQAEEVGCKVIDKDITTIKKTNKGFFIGTGKEEFNTKSIVFSQGTERRKLNIPGEEKLMGRGVSYCATCDAPLFKEKRVAIIGGSDACAMSVLMLSKYAEKVYLVYRREKNKLKMEKISQERIDKEKKIEKIFDAIPVEIKGENKVERLILNIKGKKKEIEVDGVFIEVGGIPNSKLTKQIGIQLDKEGYIITDRWGRTNIKGVFAAGDIVADSFKQIIVAAGQGATAGKAACDFVNSV